MCIWLSAPAFGEQKPGNQRVFTARSECALPLPSSGRLARRFAPVKPPLMSNVRPRNAEVMTAMRTLFVVLALLIATNAFATPVPNTAAEAFAELDKLLSQEDRIAFKSK